MGKFTQLKLKLAQMIAKMSELETDKATLVWAEERDLEAGMEVYVFKDEEYVPAEDGEYITKDNKVITVKDGKVESITDPIAEVAPEEAKAEEAKAEEAPVKEEVVMSEELYPIVADMINKMAELENRVAALESKLMEVSGQMEGAVKSVEEMSKMSAAFSAESQLEQDDEYTRKIKNFIGK